MSVFKVLIAPLLMVWWLPPAAQALWSPEPGHPPVIEQVSAFGPREEDPATLREDYVLPGESEQEEASGLLPGPDAAGRVREVIRTPDLPDQGRETYSRVDVAKVETADARAAQRKDAADALLSGVTIPEPAVLSLLAVGLLVLARLTRTGDG